MIRRMLAVLLCAGTLAICLDVPRAQAQEPTGLRPHQAYGRTWGGAYGLRDWERFYHYPYVYYPQNFWGNEYYRSSENPYYRYPREMRIPVYNKTWHNSYPESRLYHQGSHFNLDVF